MLNEKLKKILYDHKLWINGEGGYRADLRGANLKEEDLRGVNLRGVDLREVNLSGANLSGTDLRWTDLSGANLSGANLREADLTGTDLSGVNLRLANLRWANLSKANLRNADLSGADLRNADLRNTDLSRAIGLIDPIDYLNENFEKTSEGYIAYKVFGMYKTPPATWNITKKSIIKEVVNPSRTNDCGCGINISTKEWIKKKDPEIKKVWKVLIKWEWLSNVVVPYNTDGKIRCGRIMLLEKAEI